MNTKSSPSRYRYCISRRSTVATSTLTPALKVRSTTLPDRTFLSLVRTNAPPLPGLTCWKSTTLQSWPSRFSVMPFLRSLVVATCVISPGYRGPDSGFEDEQLPGGHGLGRGEQVTGRRGCCPGTNHQGVLNPDTAQSRQVDTRLDGNGNPVPECTRLRHPQYRRLVDRQPHPVAEAVAEVLVVARRRDDVPRGRVHLIDGGAGHGRLDSGPLCLSHQGVNIALPFGGLAEHDGPCHVGVVAAAPGTAVDGDHVARLEAPGAGRVVRNGPVGPAGHDRVEGRFLRAGVDHDALDQHRQVALGHPGPVISHARASRASSSSSLVTRSCSTACPSGTSRARPSAAASAVCRSTVISCASNASRPSPRATASSASAVSTGRTTSSSRSGQSRSAASAYLESVASTGGPSAGSSNAALELARPVR